MSLGRGFLLFFGILLAVTARSASAQMFVSTGASSGLRMYYPGSNDWFVDPSQGRFDLRVNGGAAPLMTVLSGGSVGIGLPNPGSLLTVMASNPYIELQNTAANRWGLTLGAGGVNNVFQIRDIVQGASRLVIDNIGNVGIGTTSPGTTLDVNGGATIRGQETIAGSSLTVSISGGDGILINSTAQNNTPLKVVSNNALSSNGVILDIRGQVPGNPALHIVNNTAELFWISAYTGYVGIGTANPAGKLHLSSGAVIIDGGGSVSVAGGSVTASAFFGDGSHLSGISGSLSGGITNVVPVWTGAASLGTGNGYITNYSTGISIQTNVFSVGVSTLVASGGYVGIGTANPQQPLHILGTNKRVMRLDTGGGNAQTFIEFINNTKTWQVGNHDAFSNYADWGVRNATDNLNPLNLTAAGSVGIGVPAPSATLHVSSAASSGTTLLMEVSSGTAAGQQLMVVQANGNVGIGTSSPAAKLHMSSGMLLIDGTNPAVSVAGGSVTASAFFGDGSHLTGVGFAGTYTTNSTTTANSIPSQSDSGAKAQYAGGWALLGSTLALTTNGRCVTVYFHGDGNIAAGNTLLSGLIMDGALVGLEAAGPPATKNLVSQYEPTAAVSVNLSFTYRFCPSAGSHAFAVYVAENNVVSINACQNGLSVCDFRVEEDPRWQ